MVVDGIMRLLLEGTADEVEYLGGDGCLSRLVVHERKLLKKVVGIVCGCLHSDDAGGMLAGATVKQSRVNLEVQDLGYERYNELLLGRLDDLVKYFACVGPLLGGRIQIDRQKIFSGQHLVRSTGEVIVDKYDLINLLVKKTLH